MVKISASPNKEIVESVKCLTHKHENMLQSPEPTLKKNDNVVACACNSPGERETGGS